MDILSNFHSSSKNSNKEADEFKTKNGRTYDCVFCQRGFTTAQALGGHMNIHRKDRASNKTAEAAANKTILVMATNEEEEEGQAIAYLSDAYYYSSPTTPSSTSYSPQFGDDWGENLSLHTFALPHIPDVATGFRQREVEELDLELRLGHSTW